MFREYFENTSLEAQLGIEFGVGYPFAVLMHNFYAR